LSKVEMFIFYSIRPCIDLSLYLAMMQIRCLLLYCTYSHTWSYQIELHLKLIKINALKLQWESWMLWVLPKLNAKSKSNAFEIVKGQIWNCQWLRRKHLNLSSNNGFLTVKGMNSTNVTLYTTINDYYLLFSLDLYRIKCWWILDYFPLTGGSFATFYGFPTWMLTMST
jgi:hypothetical protein